MTYNWKPDELDLTNCDREPIHIPGSIQPHGVLFAATPDDLVIRQCSTNTEDYFSKPYTAFIDKSLAIFFDNNVINRLKTCIEINNFDDFNPLEITIEHREKSKIFYMVAHLAVDGRLIIEFEDKPQSTRNTTFLYKFLRRAFSDVESAKSLAELYATVAKLAKELTRFDRVMIYRFDEHHNGQVVAEEVNDNLEPYLGLFYPASDIPKQARRLYTLNPIRSIVDVHYTPVGLVSVDSNTEPLDMSFCQLRSVSPIHIEYLKNMQVGASMSVSIIVDGKLWGLIACHHTESHHVTYPERIACEMIARIFALQISEYETQNIQHQQDVASLVLKQIFEDITQVDDEKLVLSLLNNSPNLLDLIPVEGVAVLFENECHTLGETPPKEDIQKLGDWLSHNIADNIFYTDQLGIDFPEFAYIKDTASGVLAMSISRIQQDYIIWFKPEQIQTVTWGGEPEKRLTTTDDGSQRLSPRKSFEAWKQIVTMKSTSWHSWQIETVKQLRIMLIETAMRIAGELRLRADILSQLNKELELSNSELDSFAYIASHDLKEPLRGIYNYSIFLLEDYGKLLPEDGIEKLNTLVRLSQRMEELINSLLLFSRVGRLNLSVREVDLNEIVQNTVELLELQIHAKSSTVVIDNTLPTIKADAVRIGEIYNNLITNALKYNDKNHPQIHIGSFADPATDKMTLYVRDNGIGIAEKHFDTVFDMFKRLHQRDKFGGGTGSGLAIVKKIIERHHGQIWIESTLGEGTTFYFTLGQI